MFTLRKNDYVAGVPVASVWLNGIATDVSRSLDATNGGVYTPGTEIDIQGSKGLRFGGTGDAAWPRLTSRSQAIHCPLLIVAKTPNVGRSSNEDSAFHAPSDLNDAIAGITFSPGCIASPIADSLAEGSVFTLELSRLPDGATLNSVQVTSKGFNGTNTTSLTLPRYYLIRSAAGAGPVGLHTITAFIADAHTTANFYTTVVTTTVAASANNVIDVSTYRYGIVVVNPFDNDGVSPGAAHRIYDIVANVTMARLGA